MSDVTPILDALGRSEPRAAGELLPLVYDELRRLAARRLAGEKPGQTLQATALVHEAYLRLVGGEPGRPWQGRGHFFAAAAEAMRRILVENARRKRRLRHGGGLTRAGSSPTRSPRRKAAPRRAARPRRGPRPPRRRRPRRRRAGQAPLLRRALDRRGRRGPRRLAAHRRPPLDVRPCLAPPGDRARIVPRRNSPQESWRAPPRTSH